MISLQKMKQIDPELSNLPDSELEEIRSSLYESAQLAFDVYWSKKLGSKYPVRLLTSPEDRVTIQTCKRKL